MLIIEMLSVWQIYVCRTTYTILLLMRSSSQLSYTRCVTNCHWQYKASFACFSASNSSPFILTALRHMYLHEVLAYFLCKSTHTFIFSSPIIDLQRREVLMLPAIKASFLALTGTQWSPNVWAQKLFQIAYYPRVCGNSPLLQAQVGTGWPAMGASTTLV